MTSIVAAAAREPARHSRHAVRVRAALALVIATFVAKHIVTTFVFPPFSGHDEVAHYGYLRTVALQGRLPLLRDPLPPDLSPYRAYALDWAAGPGYQYAAVHPPLYYFLMAPLVRASPAASPETHLYLVRLAGVWIGVATVLLAWALAREIFPNDAFMVITTPLLVAFQPQVSYEAAIVNNDALGIASAGLVLWLVARATRGGFRPAVALTIGVALGVALVAKTTALVLTPVIALAACLAPHRGWRDLLQAAGLVALATVAVAAPWYVFMLRTYGDLTGLTELAELQRSWNRSLGTFPELLFSTGFLVERFKETWGGFGWRRAPLDPGLLWAIGSASVLAAAGLVRWALTLTRLAPPWHSDDDLHQGRALLVLLCACVVAYLAVVQFGTRFALTQARYYFPVVNAAAVLAAVGFRELTPPRHRGRVQALLYVALVVLNLMIFTRSVVPAWYFPK